MNSELIHKVLNRHNLAEAARKLGEELNTSELTTFLTSVFAQRLKHIQPASLIDAIEKDRFVKPSTVSPLIFHQFDDICFKLIPRDYSLIELSPLAPLGSVSALASVDPGLVVKSERSQEVLSDCTNMLAIIAAARRQAVSPKERLELNYCASARMVRAQMPQHVNHTAHFKIFTMVSAGRDRGSFDFELTKLAEHIKFYITLISAFETSKDVHIEIVLKEYVDTKINWTDFEKRISAERISFQYQRLERQDWHYYSPFQFNVNIRHGSDTFNLADGGMVDWTQKLLSDKKERLLVSGFGTELFCKLFLLQ